MYGVVLTQDPEIRIGESPPVNGKKREREREREVGGVNFLGRIA